MGTTIWTAALITLAACTPPRLAELPPQPVSAEDVDEKLPEDATELVVDPYVFAGEHALYELRFRGVAIADLDVIVGERGLENGYPAYGVRARAEATGVAEIAIRGFWEMTTTIASGRGKNAVRVADETWQVTYAGKTAEDSETLRLSGNRHSFVSAIGAVRGWAPRLGDAAKMKIELHANFTLIMAAAAEFDVGVFRRPTVHVIGRAGHSRYGFPFEFWISRDNDRIPLLVRAMSKWGKVELELLRYRRSRDRTARLGER